MYMNNDSYMQDFYNYNQMPNNMNPYMNNGFMQNPNMIQNQNMIGGMYTNQNMYLGNNNNNQDLTNYYPSTYRIINPVVSRVVQNSNYQYLNEDTINNMVDTVFSIVDGQIDLRDDTNSVDTQTQTQTQNTTTSTNGIQRQTTTETVRSQNNSTTQNNRSDNILRDLIRILIIKELLSRRNNNINYMNY